MAPGQELMPPKIVAVDAGEMLRFPDWQVMIKLSGVDTGGSMVVLETEHDPGEGASPHIHTREDEMFFVLDGEVTFQVGDDRITLVRGGLVFGPVGTAHGFEVGSAGGRLLHVFLPARKAVSTIDEYFRQMHRADANVSIAEVRERHGMKTLA
jgi:quercetin dioxygenase-like cupin family protein